MNRRVLFASSFASFTVIAVAALGWLALAIPSAAQNQQGQLSALRLSATPNDPVARLIDRIVHGDVQLRYDDRLGYLPDLLDKLDLNVDSQTMVFAKNSFQIGDIWPDNPRAIYFNDDVTVGYIPGADLIELTSIDPKQGVVFYTLDAFDRSSARFGGCDSACHGIGEVGTLMVRSVFARPNGALIGGLGTTSHATPIEDRWGGWYVTGTHGQMTHHGNVVDRDRFRSVAPATGATLNVTSIEDRFDTAKYPAATSDIVALLTLEHQAEMTNLLMAVNRNASAVASGRMNVEWLDRAVDDAVRYMLFSDEARLDAPVEGVSEFTKTFPTRGPRDPQGRSLRDLDLKTRLFRYPLSYMIYSDLFDAIAPVGRERIYERLYSALGGRGDARTFARLTADDRQAVWEILRDTKPDLPSYWSESPLR